MSITDLILQAKAKKAQSVLFVVGSAPQVQQAGEWSFLRETPVLPSEWNILQQSVLSPQQQAILDNAANVINGLAEKYPNLEVDVSGHTDWIGSEGYNEGLSERRADAVKKYLSRKGVDPAHVQTHAYGKTKPIAPNTTEEGRALNRRAEVKTHE